MPAMKMPGGGSAPKPVPVQAKKADAADIKKTNSLTKPASVPAPKPAPIPVPIPKPAPVPAPAPAPAPATRVATSSSSVSTGSTVSNATPTATNPPMPATPVPTVTVNPEPVAVKTPTRNVTDISSLVPQYDVEEIQQLLFENLSAIELSKIERHDTIEGISQKYSIISNLSEIRTKYDSIKQLTVMEKFKPLTNIYTINIQDKIPQEDYLIVQNLYSTYQYLDENNEIVTRERGHYYIDTNGDLVIELINIEQNQQIEVLIDTNGTIYKVES